MLRLYDTRTGQVAPVAPAGARAVRMYSCGARLLADLVRRVAEVHGLRVIAYQDAPSPPGALAWNIRTAQYAPWPRADAAVALITRLRDEGHAGPGPDGTVITRSGHVLWRAVPHASDATAWTAPWGRGIPDRHLCCAALALRLPGERFEVHVSDSAAHCLHGHVVDHRGHDEQSLFDLGSGPAARFYPLAVRLALLEGHYRQPADLSDSAVRAAEHTLRHWRRRVAEWAESPSQPIAADHAARIQQAFDDDLDTPRALRLLRELDQDESIPPGSRCETFLHFDQILGLDLASEIGRLPAR